MTIASTFKFSWIQKKRKTWIVVFIIDHKKREDNNQIECPLDIELNCWNDFEMEIFSFFFIFKIINCWTLNCHRDCEICWTDWQQSIGIGKHPKELKKNSISFCTIENETKCAQISSLGTNETERNIPCHKR